MNEETETAEPGPAVGYSYLLNQTTPNVVTFIILPFENTEATKRNSTAAISCKIALIWDALPPCPLWAAVAVNSWASGPFLNLALLDVWGRHPGHATLLGR